MVPSYHLRKNFKDFGQFGPVYECIKKDLPVLNCESRLVF